MQHLRASPYAFLTRFRSIYKTPCHALKVLSATAPLYLSDLIQMSIPVRLLRSQSYSRLTKPKSHTAMGDEKSFSPSAPRLWNKFPGYIKLAGNKKYLVRF